MCFLKICRQSGGHLLTNQIQPIHRRTVLLKEQNALSVTPVRNEFKLGLFLSGLSLSEVPALIMFFFVFCEGAMVEACASLLCLSCIFIILFCPVIYVYLRVLGHSWTCMMPNLLAFIFMTFAMCSFFFVVFFYFHLYSQPHLITLQVSLDSVSSCCLIV